MTNQGKLLTKHKVKYKIPDVFLCSDWVSFLFAFLTFLTLLIWSISFFPKNQNFPTWLSPQNLASSSIRHSYPTNFHKLKKSQRQSQRSTFHLRCSNGRVSACRYRQKQKSYRKFPPASILAWKGQRVKTKIIHIFCQKWPILIMILILSS